MALARTPILAVPSTTRIPARNIRIASFVRGEDPRSQLATLHRDEIRIIAPRVLRLCNAGHPASEIGKYAKAYRREFGIHRVEVVYDFVERFGNPEDGGARFEGVYVPFLVDGEYFAVRYFPESARRDLGELLLPDRHVLFRAQEDGMVFEYIHGEDFEDFRFYFSRLVFDNDADLASSERANQTFLAGIPEFRDLMVKGIHARVGEGKRLLSIGHGTAELEEELIALGHQVVGIDASPQMVEIASRKGVEAVVGDAHELTRLVSGQFDGVLFPESIGYLWEADVLDEVRRVLAPEGKLWIITYALAHRANGYRRRPLAELIAIIERAGFRILLSNSLIISPEIMAMGSIVRSKDVPRTEVDTDNIQTITAGKVG